MANKSLEGVQHFIAKPEEVDARTDAIAEANGKLGLLTMVGRKQLEDGNVEVTCIPFAANDPAQAQQAMQELSHSQQDQTAVKAPSEGQAPANLEF